MQQEKLVLDQETFLAELPYEAVRLQEAKTLEETVLPFAGAGAIQLTNIQWMQTSYKDVTSPEVTVKPEQPQQPTAIIHNFTNQGITSETFTIKGSLTSSKGTVSYKGETLTKALKMESATKIQFETSNAATLTLVANTDCNKSVLIDGTKYNFQQGILNISLSAGNHTIIKGDSNVNVYYMEIN